MNNVVRWKLPFTRCYMWIRPRHRFDVMFFWFVVAWMLTVFLPVLVLMIALNKAGKEG